ncbi:MAG: PA14 domain protein [Lentisphaerae bacterium ADurb.BinA184]|nr:MAG: PA14 domain protein [Lentisphaerae bacterium ADurb.BinA184]
MKTMTLPVVVGMLALAVGTVASALDLQGGLSTTGGTKIGSSLTIEGTAFNADPEGAFVNGGLRAFYWRTGGGKTMKGTAYTVGDAPLPGELPQGRNSEFAANPTGEANWWLLDDAAFRTANGIPGTATGQRLPPFLMRKYFQQLTDDGDNQTTQQDNFLVQMEGKLVVASDTIYQFNGGGDDYVHVWLDGKLVHQSGMPGQYGPVAIPAGEHGFTAEFIEGGGGQYYSFGIPAGATLKANPEDEHTYAGYVLEYGTTYAEQRPGMLTLKVMSQSDGSGGQLGDLSYFKSVSSNAYMDDLSPSPTVNNYQLVMAGYWNCPGGTFSFGGGADDRYLLAIGNPGEDPWTIAPDMDNYGISGSTSLSGVTLPAGWLPIRLAFGEGGGGAYWDIWYNDGTGGKHFNQFPADIRSTADSVYDWALLTLSGNQIPTEGVLYEWDAIPSELIKRPLDLRLSVYDTNHGVVQSQIALFLKIPEPTTVALLGGSLALGCLRRRRG